jgi:tRNA threonylcarbamoyladenosine biosynthesis protein TsaB
MPLLLLIDTSTTLCSVAIARGTTVISTREHDGDFKHAELLTTFIQECCTEANCNLQAVDAIVISKGPGSYTGLRIGVSTAKGIAYAINKPLISVNTLHAMATTISKTITEQHNVCAMIDARRMEVYDLIINNTDEIIKETTAQIVETTTYNAYCNIPFYYCGDGADKCQEALKHLPNALFVPNVKTSASNMLALALAKYEQKLFEDVAYFEPYYLKEFVAGKSKKII